MTHYLFVVLLLFGTVPVTANAFPTEIQPLIDRSCIQCHDADTETGLDFESLGDDLNDPPTYRQWVKVHDRIKDGSMPPKSRPRPDAALLTNALTTLRTELRETNRAAQLKQGRVPLRRLTKTEYQQTLRDLLHLEHDFGKGLPPAR